MKFSMMSYTLMRQKIFTPADCVRVAVELGMDGIDWVTTYGEDPRELRKRCDDAGLPVVAHTFFLHRVEPDQLRDTIIRNMDNAVILGAPIVMLPPSPFPGESDPLANRRRWLEILRIAAPIARERGLVMTVENFPGKASPVVTSEDFYTLQSEIPELKLTFDNGNAFPGEDVEQSLRRCFRDIVHVHFKDWVRRDDFAEGWKEMSDGKFYLAALIGEGVVDSRATLRVLEELHYTGYINIEYENCAYRGDAAIKRVLEYLRG